MPLFQCVFHFFFNEQQANLFQENKSGLLVLQRRSFSISPQMNKQKLHNPQDQQSDEDIFQLRNE